MRSRSQGVALASVLVAVAALVTLTATLFFLLFLDGQSSRNFAAGADALYAAEAGLQHLWSIVDPAPDFSRELGWPDGRPPFAAPVWFPEPPRTYRVNVAPGPEGSLRVVSEGTGGLGARRRVEGILRRDREFRPLALLVIADTSRAAVTGVLTAVPEDRERSLPAPPAFGAEDKPSARTFQAGFAEPPRVVVVGESGFDEALPLLRASPDRTVTGPHSDAVWGQPGSPEITLLLGQAEIAGNVTAAGIVIADAPLRVRGGLRVEGLLLASAGVEVEGTLEVAGAIVIAGGIDVGVTGAVRLQYASTPLAEADRLRPGVLPRGAFLGAWREVW